MDSLHQEEEEAPKKAVQPAAKKAKTESTDPDATSTIYVGGLSFSIDEPALKAEFEQFGTVTSARIITDRASGNSKGSVTKLEPVRRAQADLCLCDLRQIRIRRL